jgi:tRNA threonylcarbamoyladenosine biosynthesis protein TsaE
MAPARCRIMATFISHSPEDTAALGEEWGRAARPGWVIGLSGDLGAGKTQLVKGLARGLGIQSRVQSPTFALVNEYAGGRLPLAHVDLYRLETPAQIIAAGLEEYFHRPPGVSIIEWCERWPGFLAPDPSRAEDHSSRGSRALRVPATNFRRVRIEQTAETERRITYEDLGD